MSLRSTPVYSRPKWRNHLVLAYEVTSFGGGIGVISEVLRELAVRVVPDPVKFEPQDFSRVHDYSGLDR